MIKVVAKNIVKEECVEAYIEGAKELIEKSRKETGNISYSLNRSTMEPNAFAFIEIWESPEIFKAHCASEHFTRIMPVLDSMTAGAPDINLYEEID